ncbi:MAG TPA: cytochrome b/b6 domain-containing protein [Burkholderiales bacterium]
MTRTWSKTSKAFHWVGAAFIFYLLIHGFWMVGLPRELRFSHYETHAAAGYLFIALTLARLAWRWTHAVPPQPPGASRWEVIAAHAGHWGLYGLMLASALSGWALAGTFKRPLDSLFGWFTVPGIVPAGSAWRHEMFEEAHELLAWALALLVLAHVAAALYHWLWRKDDVMQRMLR